MADLCSAALRVSRDNRAAVARTAAARTAARTATAFLSLVVSSVSVPAAGERPQCVEGCSQRSCHSQRDALVWHVLMRPTTVFAREQLSTPISRIILFLL